MGHVALPAIGRLALGSAQAAPVTTLFADYDATFASAARCDGTACEQAVAEFCNGDNGTAARTFEWNVGPTTLAPADRADVTGLGGTGLWNGAARGFALA